ncbi:NADH-quinone oxidoreductase subunit NuoI [Candidatus Palibaumannia cicadellinicola]|uniref:NADH-quinone oxidoreductase subunit I n=1 Tax=Baumannia cicadellinicola subsp. Homalodisca coagulata TaxID=374463 RepID=NUOI_BAUCH|nr:NADH-quinone oxidoreductase subunit NuoI [Candidatus Baumannia cicadellinicola]Q1LT96.1 RecName: Full=NADH-quinone oxidoreductase subunit I; AltName: Full=NADH dehydrogenase I subunit I; AltName: Full=NDH-1 subunit I [Baumannia cicadellinicola str. Hc (Homalodisca coagulata)]ABF13918.1 NADH-quinone oxidoreductase, chain I [Baumannia cicadellinicola str. Hc (Homalodisca coagulata)]MCJ7462201.1 NADH-quinone oxidoreductase subunit NuoI [Candidatus Baumannia cicadellinicola]MCJ7462719.1 NADH-qui
MTLKQLVTGCYTILRSIWMIGMQAFNKRETQMYPDIPIYQTSRFRGRIVLTCDPDGYERCVACNLCAVACPVDCISLQKTESKEGRWYPEFFRINFSRCIFCGLCEEACPTTAIQLTPDFEMAEFKRQDLVYEKEDLLIRGPGKYPEYNFYRMAGIACNDKLKGHAENETRPINVKDLLP